MTDPRSHRLEIPGTLAEALREMVRRGQLPTSDAKRHHFIPRFLLRSFREPGTQRLYQLDKTTGECLAVTPEAAASRRRLYRVTDDTGEDNDYLEGLLALVEDHAARSIRALTHDPYRLDEGGRANVAFLLALQDQRTPAGQGRARRQLAAIARLVLETRLEDRHEFLRLDRQFFGRRRPAEEVEQFRQLILSQLSSRELGIQPSKELILRTMLEGWLDRAGLAASLSWKILRTETGEFVIGDRPLTMTDPTPPYPWSGNAWISSDHA
jgi:hypothetical protein